MEYCSGGDLGKLISKHCRDKTQVDESFIWKVFAQSIVALGHCHRRKDDQGVKRPVIHLDLKPVSMLLDSNGNIKIADFGLAKESSTQTRFAITNVGMPVYMAPEIINQKDYDEKADIWSLGCVLYELASTRPPFDAPNALSLAHKINLGKFSRIPSKYSDPLQDAIKGMLTPDPRKRIKLEECEEMPMLQMHLLKARSVTIALYDQLLSNGIISNAVVRNGAGQTVLHRIPQIGVENKEVNTGVLLSYVVTCDPSADVNARDSTGHTPMSIAALSNNTAATKLLIDFGADRTIRSNNDAGSNPNSTPLDIAIQSNHKEIVKLLTEYFPSEE